MLNTYGTRVVDQLARDIVSAFAETQGFSARNLWRMRAFYLAHPAPKILPQPVAELGEADHDPIVYSRPAERVELSGAAKPGSRPQTWQSTTVPEVVR